MRKVERVEDELAGLQLSGRYECAHLPKDKAVQRLCGGVVRYLCVDASTDARRGGCPKLNAGNENGQPVKESQGAPRRTLGGSRLRWREETRRRVSATEEARVRRSVTATRFVDDAARRLENSSRTADGRNTCISVNLPEECSEKIGASACCAPRLTKVCRSHRVV